jgi:hypothetical protein
MKTATAELVQKYGEDITSLMTLYALNADQDQINSYLDDVKIIGEDREILLKLTEKVAEQAKPYAEVTAEFFKDEKTDEDIQQYLVEEGFEENLAEQMTAYLAYDLIAKEIHDPLMEMITEVNDYDKIISDLKSGTGLEKEIVELAVHGILREKDPDKMARMIVSSASRKKVRNGVLWSIGGIVATFLMEGAVFFYGAVVYGLIILVQGLYLRFKS